MGDFRRWTARGVATLAALEAAALVLCASLLASRAPLRAYIERNELSRSLRVGMLAATCLAALACGGGVAWLSARGGEAYERCRRRVLAWSPSLALWALPALWTPSAFEDRPFVVLGAAAALALGLERAARAAWPAGRLVSLFGRRWAGWDVAVAAMAAAESAWAAAWSIRLHHKGLTSNYDLGLFENLFWNTLHGAQGRALDGPYFGEHAELILYPLAPLYAAAPRAETLLALQALALGSTAVPLYLIARRWLGPTLVAASLPAAYLLFPAVHGTSFYDFHFLALSPPFVAWGAYFFLRRWWRAFAAAALGAFLCREDVALGAGLVGVGLFLLGRHRRATLGLAAAAFAWFVLVKLVWMQSFQQDSFVGYYRHLVAPGTSGFKGVAQTLLSNPLFVLSRALTEAKLLLLLHLTVPLALLPLRQWRTTVLLLPGLAVIGLASSDAAVNLVHFHYTCHFTPYLFVAAAAALAVRPPPARAAASAALLAATSIATVHYGALFRDPFRASFHDVSFAWTPADAERQGRLRRAVAVIPERASVAAAEHEGPHVARRPVLRALKHGIGPADHVFYGLRSLRWGGADEAASALRSGDFGVVHTDGDLTVLRRGAPTDGNARALADLRKARLIK